MKLAVTGFAHMKGIAAKSKKPYEMARLYRLTQIRDWETDMGKSQANGYETNERNVLDVDITDEKLIKAFMALPFEQTNALVLELNLEPNPDDPMRNIVTGFDVVKLA